jgi:c-di-GMP-related signal transduction protein
MHNPFAAGGKAPAREVLVARQPVLDAEMNLLGFELLVDGTAVVIDALSEIGLEALTGGHAAWLPLGRDLLLDVGPVPVRSDRVVLQVPAGDGEDPALFARSQKVGSVREAMVLLGANNVRRWATVLVMGGMPDQPHVLLVTALVRARTCELLSDGTARRDRAFTVGMFSVINRLLGLPMREALETLPLSEDVTSALLRGEGPEGRSLRTVLAWELGDFTAAEAIQGGPERVGRAYRDAVAWADETAASLQP